MTDDRLHFINMRLIHSVRPDLLKLLFFFRILLRLQFGSLFAGLFLPRLF